MVSVMTSGEVPVTLLPTSPSEGATSPCPDGDTKSSIASPVTPGVAETGGPIVAEDVLLDIIDTIRRRKARPDLLNIQRQMKKRLNTSHDETSKLLENMVEQDRVIKVDYKGAPSYRNPDSWRKAVNFKGVIINSDRVSVLLRAGLESLQRERGTIAIKVTEITKWLTDNCPADVLEMNSTSGETTDAKVLSYVNREVMAGKLYRMKSREHICFPEQAKLLPTLAGPPSKKARVELPTHEDRCDYCQREERVARPLPASQKHSISKTVKLEPGCENTSPDPPLANLAVKEKLLKCSECFARAHPSCMGYSVELAERAYLGKWQCSSCKTCCLCYGCDEGDSLLICDSCDKGYHMRCHRPRLDRRPHTSWLCSQCRPAASGLQSCHRPQHLRTGLSVRGRTTLPLESCGVKTEELARVTDWGVSEVLEYMTAAGHEASPFRDQEIDGAALLLLKRGDILGEMKLRLGPALKLYERVRVLQRAFAAAQAKLSRYSETPEVLEPHEYASLPTPELTPPPTAHSDIATPEMPLKPDS